MEQRKHGIQQSPGFAHSTSRPRRSSAKDLSHSHASDEDWTKITDVEEKKRVQNRVAQRNYRRNVKRRIEELEQQVATQADLLALADRAGGSLAQSMTPRVDFDQLNGEQSSRSFFGSTVSLPSQAENQYSRRGFCAEVETNDCTLPNYHSGELESTPMEMTVEEGVAKKSSPTSGLEKDSLVLTDSLNHPQAQRFNVPCTSGAKFMDWKMGVYDNQNFPSPMAGSLPTTCSTQEQRQSSSLSSWSVFDEDANSSPVQAGSQSNASRPTIQPPPVEAGIGERMDYLLKCVQAAGFQDFDSALIDYYTAKFDEGTVCCMSQRFSRKRHLPKLLEALQHDATSWTAWEGQAYRDEILRSAESLLVAEIRTLSIKEDNFLDSITTALLAGQEVDWNHVLRASQNETPNLWSFLAGLLSHGAKGFGTRHQSRLVLAAMSLLCVADNRPAEQISRIVSGVLTR